MTAPIPLTGIYFPHHPLHPSPPTAYNRVTCFLAGHSYALAQWQLTNPPHALIICLGCSLYLSVQYPPLASPTITLPIEQARAIQH